MAELEPKNWFFWWGGLTPQKMLWRWIPRAPILGVASCVIYLRIFLDRVELSSSIRNSKYICLKKKKFFWDTTKFLRIFKNRSRPLLDFIKDYLHAKFQPPKSKTVASRTQKPPIFLSHIVLLFHLCVISLSIHIRSRGPRSVCVTVGIIPG